MFLFEQAHSKLHVCKKSEWVTDKNFEIKTNVSCMFCFLFVQFYAAFHFRYFACKTFDRNLDSFS